MSNKSIRTGKTLSIILTALCIALGIVLPMTLHAIPNSGSILLPMHIPVLMCGIICGWPYGLACGILTPLLSALITGMPPMAILPSMICELAAYGLVSGLIYYFVNTKKSVIDIYLSLIGAMIIGRIIYGVINALIFRAGSYTMQIWLTASFVTALPGIIIQIILIPAVILVLQKARLIKVKY